MTRVVIVADSGPVLADLTAAVAAMPGAYIARHGSSAAPLDRVVGPLAPDLVVIGGLLAPADAPARVEEVRRAAPAAVVVALRTEPYPDRIANTLAARASAVLPSGLEPHELGDALLEIVSGGVVLGAAA